MPSTDRPDWWETLDQQMASREERTRRSIAVNYPVDLYPLVLAAAKSRNLSMTAYQRRAVLAFAQADTGFNWLTEMAAEPAVTTYVGGTKSEMRGLGFGAWQILDLRCYKAPDE